MEILFTSPGYKSAINLGGTVLVVSELAENLVRLGHQVTIYTTNSNYDQALSVPLNTPIEINGVKIWYFKYYEPLKRFLFFLPYFANTMGIVYSPAMWKKLYSEGDQFELIYAHLPFIYPTWVAARAARRHHRPFFYHDHGVLDPNRLKYRALKKQFALFLVERPIMRSATTLFALSPAGCQAYRKLGIERPCCVIPNGIAVENYRMSPSSMMSQRLRQLDKKILLLYFGQLLPIKGPLILLEAFLSIVTEFPDAVLVYAGPDPCRLQLRIMNKAQHAGFGNRVKFLGTVSGEEKKNLLARADIFCLPSKAEGFSIAVLEALASATPVLLTPGCYFPRVAEAGAGLIVDRTVRSLSWGLRLLLGSPGMRRQMATSARQLVEAEYTWPRVAALMADAYREGIERYKFEKIKLE